MNHDLHHILNKAGRQEGLSKSERERMRGTLHAYVTMKPARRPGAPARARSRYFFGPLTMRYVSLALVAILFISSAGVSYAAEGALPGDALYAVKTNINEPLQGALAITSSAKTAWAMSVATARVQEATTLAAEGKLDPETQAALQASFSAHAQIAANNIEQQASTSPDLGAEVATRFEAQLNEYQRMLTQVAQVSHVEASPLATAVADESARVAGIGARAAAASSATSSTAAIAASRMRDAARSAIDDSTKLAGNAISALASSSAALVSQQLNDASATLAAGEEYLQSNESPRALTAFSDALSATAKLGVFLQTSASIHERTGLRIAEPSHDATSSDNGPRGGSSDIASAMRPRPTTFAAKMAPAGTGGNAEDTASAPEVHATMFAAEAPATGSVNATETPTTTATTTATSTATQGATSTGEVRHGQNEQGPVNMNTEGEDGGNARGGYLPIALPDGGGLVH